MRTIFRMLGLAAVAIFAGRAEAQPFLPQNPTITLPCGAVYYQRVSIFGSGVFAAKPPAVDFIFWVWAPGPCSAYGVRVNWVYQIANKANQQIVQTIFGSTTYKVIPYPSGVTQLILHCAPKLANTYCRNAAATLVAGKFPNPPYILGSATATIGPLLPQ
jgi:hypothetical protein